MSSESITPLHHRRGEFAPALSDRDSAWELYDRIDPVAVAYLDGGRYHVSEHNSARRLLKELHRMGRARVPVIGFMSAQFGFLDRASLGALNAYLRHHFGALSWRQVHARDGLHRFGWYAMQREVGLRWRR